MRAGVDVGGRKVGGERGALVGEPPVAQGRAAGGGEVEDGAEQGGAHGGESAGGAALRRWVVESDEGGEIWRAVGRITLFPTRATRLWMRSKSFIVNGLLG